MMRFWPFSQVLKQPHQKGDIEMARYRDRVVLGLVLLVLAGVLHAAPSTMALTLTPHRFAQGGVDICECPEQLIQSCTNSDCGDGDHSTARTVTVYVYSQDAGTCLGPPGPFPCEANVQIVVSSTCPNDSSICVYPDRNSCASGSNPTLTINSLLRASCQGADTKEFQFLPTSGSPANAAAYVTLLCTLCDQPESCLNYWP